MSGRASRVLLSVLLLSAVLAVPSLVLAPAALAAPPPVTLEYTAKNQVTCGTSCNFGVLLIGGTNVGVTMYAATTGNNDGNISSAVCGVSPSFTLSVVENFTIGNYPALNGFSHIYLLTANGVGPGTYSCGATVVRPGISGTTWIYSTQAWDNVNPSSMIAQHVHTSGTTELTYTDSVATIPPAQNLLVDWIDVVGGNPSCGFAPCLPTPGAGQSQTWVQLANANYGLGSTKPGDVSVTMSGSVSAANTVWGYIVADIRGVPALVAAFTYGITGQSYNFLSVVSGGTTPYSYSWGFGDGHTSTAADPSHTYSAAGKYTVYMNVTDSGGQSQNVSTSLFFSPGSGTPPPPPPPPPNVVTYPQLINFNCNVVTFNDPRGDAAVASTVLWTYNFGDGSAIDYSPVPQVTHTYTVSGVYDATMTVQDRQGNAQTYGISVDTTPTGCAGAVVRGVLPPTFFGVFVALLVASFVAGKKYPKWKRRLRSGAVISFAVVIGIVVLL